jgi:hypothetical protein
VVADCENGQELLQSTRTVQYTYLPTGLTYLMDDVWMDGGADQWAGLRLGPWKQRTTNVGAGSAFLPRSLPRAATRTMAFARVSGQLSEAWNCHVHGPRNVILSVCSPQRRARGVCVGCLPPVYL